MIAEGTFCFEEEHIGCVCGWCHMSEEEVRESLGQEQGLKALAAKYLPEDPSKVEWTPVPEPKPLGEMSKADREFVKAIYWGYFHGAAQEWKNNDAFKP